jgi:hypothetical protein
MGIKSRCDLIPIFFEKIKKKKKIFKKTTTKFRLVVVLQILTFLLF